MKSLRKSLSSLLILAVLMTAVLAFGITAHAASAVVPKKIRMYPDSTGTIDITYAQGGDTIKNLKTSSSSMIAKWTSHSSHTGNSSSSTNEASISLYTKKKGLYTVSFDTYTASGVKRSSHKVKVYVKDDSPIKSSVVKIKGKEWTGSYTTASAATVRVKMNKGYTLKKLEYSVNTLTKDESGNWDTDISYKKFSNGGKVKLNKIGYYYYHAYSYTSSYNPEYDYAYVYWSDSLWASTSVRVTYIDKYTKEECTTFIGLPSRMVKGSSR